jgi:putative ABC transport system permease protein
MLSRNWGAAWAYALSPCFAKTVEYGLILALVSTLGSAASAVVYPLLILALTGYFTGTDKRPVRDIGRTSLTGPATVILAGIAIVAVIAGVARRPLGPLGREDVALTHPSPRRLALEGLVAITAALGVYLLRRRGLEASPTGDGGFDPYLAGVPVLLGLACGIVALRFYPLPIRGAAWLVRRTRGLALHLGLRLAGGLALLVDVGSAWVKAGVVGRARGRWPRRPALRRARRRRGGAS